MSPGESDEDIQFKKGSGLVKNKQFNEALEIFTNLVISNPSNEQAWVARGVVLSYLENYKDAELAFNQALRINPNNQTALNNRDMVRKHLNPSLPAHSGIKPPVITTKPKPKIQLKKWERVAILLVCIAASFIWPNILTQILLPIYFIALVYIIGWTHDPTPSA